MGQQELIEALWRKGEEKIAGIREQAEKEAMAFSDDLAERLRLKRQSCAAGRDDFRDMLLRNRTLQADRQKRAYWAEARGELAERLEIIAAKLLPELRGQGYEALFERLVGEIREVDIDQVAVNPADRALAERHFPSAIIVTDPAVAGGLRIRGNRGGMVIDNTLEKRLQRCWQQLLPQLIKEIEEAVD